MSFLDLILRYFFGIILLVLSYLLQGYLRSPLKNIPGPFFAKFTNLWRLFDVYGRRAELTHRMLHEKYGQAVRIGPNTVSLSDPKLIRTIYSVRGDFLKSDYYTVSDSMMNGIRLKSIFSTQDNDQHAQFLRSIAKSYKTSNLLAYEPLIDTTIQAFCRNLDERFVNGNRTCEIDKWLHFFSWDVIGQLTFSRPMGFMDAGRDFSGYLKVADDAVDYTSVVGQLPWLDFWLAKNPIKPIGPASFKDAVGYCAQQMIARMQGTDDKISSQKDMLDEFIDTKRTNPKMMDDHSLVGALLVNFLAGSDTTAILLRSILYYVLKNPRVYKKLIKELDYAKLSLPISYETASRLSYLDAVVMEANRVHPAVGILLERIVPTSGLTLSDGTAIPPGTIVGINAWVAHLNKGIFGQDAESFIPERWLRKEDANETEAEYQERLTAMKHADLAFGAGKRVCLGKVIALMETYKVISTLFLLYEMKLVDPEKPWHVENSWFMRQSNIKIKIRRRRPSTV